MDPDTQRRLDGLADVVIAGHAAHTDLAAAHDKLADEVRRKEEEASLAKRLNLESGSAATAPHRTTLRGWAW